MNEEWWNTHKTSPRHYSELRKPKKASKPGKKYNAAQRKAKKVFAAQMKRGRKLLKEHRKDPRFAALPGNIFSEVADKDE